MRKTVLCLLLAFLSACLFSCRGNSGVTDIDTAPEIRTETEVQAAENDTRETTETADPAETSVVTTEATTETEAETETETEIETESDAESAAETETETETEAVPETEADPYVDDKLYADVYGYIGRHESEIPADMLRENGFVCETVCEYANLPKGQIFALEFSENFIPNERTSEKKITFKVSLGTDPKNCKTEEGSLRVYLTFDDGPNPKNTERILKTLDEYGIKATFFSVGRNAKANPDVMRSVAKSGHALGCHSFTHDYKALYEDSDSFRAEISEWESTAESILGYIPSERLFRFPGGSTNCKTEGIKDVLCELGYRGFDWNALNNDCYIKKCPKDMTEDEFLRDTFRKTVENSLKMKHNPHIVLMHETYSQTADMLPYAIEYLIEKGCTFGTLDELPSGWYY